MLNIQYLDYMIRSTDVKIVPSETKTTVLKTKTKKFQGRLHNNL